MNGSLALLDVNVPMYAAGRAHPYKDACTWVMTAVAEGRLVVAIDAEIVQEVLHRFGALGQWQLAVALANALLDLVPTVYPVTADVVRRAIDLLPGYGPAGVRARDLLHVAVMQEHGLTRIISADRHFDQVEGITRLDPQGLFRQAMDTG